LKSNDASKSVVIWALEHPANTIKHTHPRSGMGMVTDRRALQASA
jgi:hypothetical protein